MNNPKESTADGKIGELKETVADKVKTSAKGEAATATVTTTTTTTTTQLRVSIGTLAARNPAPCDLPESKALQAQLEEGRRSAVARLQDDLHACKAPPRAAASRAPA